jgi:hypothetical protein
VGGCAANAAVSEFADRPPTPDPPRHALTRAEGGEKKMNSNVKQPSCDLPQRRPGERWDPYALARPLTYPPLEGEGRLT